MMKRRFRKKNYASQPDKRSINPLKHIYDSSGAPTRMRGNAQQLHEKYTTLAREALRNGDRIAMEQYYQYAEHYQRQINQFQENMDSRNRDFGPPPSSPHSPPPGDFGDPRPRKTNGRRPPSAPPPYDDFDDFSAPPRSQAKTTPDSETPDNENGDSLPIPGAISADEPPRKVAKAKGRPRKLPPKPAEDDDNGGEDDDIF